MTASDGSKQTYKVMKHFTKTQKAIVDAYFEARQANKWDDVTVKSPAELRQVLIDGKVLKQVMDEIEIRYTSITSIILASTKFNHLSNSYKAGIRRGFRTLFSNLKID